MLDLTQLHLKLLNHYKKNKIILLSNHSKLKKEFYNVINVEVSVLFHIVNKLGVVMKEHLYLPYVLNVKLGGRCKFERCEFENYINN